MISFQIENPSQINAKLSKMCKRNLHFWGKKQDEKQREFSVLRI